jgi:hypothetical protein
MTRHAREPESLLPLTAVAFEILLTLSDGDCHTATTSCGGGTPHLQRHRAASRTLYRALARLLGEELIDERGDRPSRGTTPRRRAIR